ncbi:MAG TPA: dihydrofolate reductase family protein [Gemmatimonadaceae bacterium]|jgi:dihydrofolate reductase|nr:dihydrofolate reductase family protein [Gemmatimonadaceae bacterium]
MRPLRYNVAASLDGFIAGPRGEFDWIPHDSAVDFGALFANVDTVLIGRRTYEVMLTQGESAWSPTARVYVVSRTLDPAEHPGVTIVRDDPVAIAASLRAEEGSGDIWLFGGGELFATLLDGGQVDTVEVTVVPILLGGGVPLLPPRTGPHRMSLTHSQVYPSGMVALHYRVGEQADLTPTSRE